MSVQEFILALLDRFIHLVSILTTFIIILIGMGFTAIRCIFLATKSVLKTDMANVITMVILTIGGVIGVVYGIVWMAYYFDTLLQ